MKKRWKITIGTTVAIALLIPVANYFLVRNEFVMRLVWGHFIHQAQQRRVLLLCKTDHHVLLKAGREILSQVPKDRLNQRLDGHRILGDFGVPEAVQIPQAIRDLKPRGCLISCDGYLTLEMHGGMDHFGIRIYPENF